MKKKIISQVIILVILFSVIATSSPVLKSPALNQETKYVPGELIVILEENHPGPNIQDVLTYSSSLALSTEPIYKGGYPVKEDSEILNAFIVHFPEKTNIKEMAKIYSRIWFVKYAEPNYILEAAEVPTDPLFPEQWGLQKIQAQDAYDEEMGSEEIVIAILDTGADLNHEDLENKLLPGYNFIDGEEGLPPEDDHGHGTRICGIAAAETNNGLGIASSCPGCKILPLRTCYYDGGPANCRNADIYEALVFLTENPTPNLVSMSFGSYDYIPVIENKINELNEMNIYSIAAAGNGDTNNNFYPAAYENVIAVAATNQNDERITTAQYGWGSNYGSWVDIAAPGVDITTTNIGGGYGTSLGTSASAPFVSGLVGLMLSKNSGLTFEEIKQILIDSSDPVTGFPEIQGGRINSYKTLLNTSEPINLPPQLQPMENNITVHETESVLIFARAIDPEGQDLQFSINDNRFEDFSLPDEGNVQGAYFTWHTYYYDEGEYQFEITISDGQNNLTEPVYITVLNTPRPSHPKVEAFEKYHSE